MIVELLSAEHDPSAGTLVYRVALLAEEEDEVWAVATPLEAPAQEQTFGPGYRFVDDPAPSTICLTPPDCPWGSDVP